MMGSLRNHRFIRYLLAGGVNTLFGYGIYGMLVLFGIWPYIAVIIGTVIGIFFNFITTSIAFHSRDFRRLPSFLLSYLPMLGINMVLLNIFMRAGLGPLVAQAVVLPIFPLTFLAMRRFVFAALPEQNV